MEEDGTQQQAELLPGDKHVGNAIYCLRGSKSQEVYDVSTAYNF